MVPVATGRAEEVGVHGSEVKVRRDQASVRCRASLHPRAQLECVNDGGQLDVVDRRHDLEDAVEIGAWTDEKANGLHFAG